jgi:hypothetical protein
MLLLSAGDSVRTRQTLCSSLFLKLMIDRQRDRRWQVEIGGQASRLPPTHYRVPSCSSLVTVFVPAGLPRHMFNTMSNQHVLPNADGRFSIEKQSSISNRQSAMLITDH